MTIEQHTDDGTKLLTTSQNYQRKNPPSNSINKKHYSLQ